MKSKNSNVINAIMALLSLAIFGLLVQACGEETPCEKARDIQKRICRENHSEECFPCACYLKGREPDWSIDHFGFPDLSTSSCKKLGPCEGLALEYAEACIDDERTCDPRYYLDVMMFNNGQSAPGFEGMCEGRW